MIQMNDVINKKTLRCADTSTEPSVHSVHDVHKGNALCRSHVCALLISETSRWISLEVGVHGLYRKFQERFIFVLMDPTLHRYQVKLYLFSKSGSLC